MKQKQTGETIYSKDIPGNKRNWDQTVRFDFTDGYIGIAQEADRVLLTPRQFDELVKFVKREAAKEGEGECLTS